MVSAKCKSYAVACSREQVYIRVINKIYIIYVKRKMLLKFDLLTLRDACSSDPTRHRQTRAMIYVAPLI